MLLYANCKIFELLNKLFHFHFQKCWVPPHYLCHKIDWREHIRQHVQFSFLYLNPSNTISVYITNCLKFKLCFQITQGLSRFIRSICWESTIFITLVCHVIIHSIASWVWEKPSEGRMGVSSLAACGRWVSRMFMHMQLTKLQFFSVLFLMDIPPWTECIVFQKRWKC